MRVLVTRPIAQAAELERAIVDRGAVPVSVPLIEITRLAPDGADLAALAKACVVVFVSRNAVTHLGRGAPLPADATVVAIGPATRAALAARGIDAHLTGDGTGGSEALLVSLPRVGNGDRVCIVKGRGGRDVLRAHYVKLGAEVVELDVYERRAPVGAEAACRAALDDGLDAVILTSVEAADVWLRALATDARDTVLASIRHAALSERIGAHLRDAGAAQVVVARGSGAQALAHASLVEHPDATPVR